jgi:hypothetical protein
MGMHFGIFAAQCPLRELEPILSELGTLEPFDPADAQPDDVLFGEHDGQTFMQEGLMELTTNGDFIVQLSERLNTLVVGCGAETVSGSYWLFAADKGRLLRCYWACESELSEPLDEGEWGQGVPLDDLDGEGFITLLRRAGLKYDQFLEHFSVRRLELGPTFELPDGPVMRRISEHTKAHQLPANERLAPQLVLRPVHAPAPGETPTPSSVATGTAPAARLLPTWVIVAAIVCAVLGVLARLFAR